MKKRRTNGKHRLLPLCAAAVLLSLLCCPALAEETELAAILRNTYPEQMRVLGGEAWDGCEVLDISEIDAYSAAVVRENGALSLVLMAQNDGGWTITDRLSGLFDAVGQDEEVSLWYNSYGTGEPDDYRLSVYIGDTIMLYFVARESEEGIGLWLNAVECNDPALAWEAVPELAAMDSAPTDNVWFTAAMYSERQARVTADVYTAEGEGVFFGGDFVDPTGFTRPIDAFSLREVLAWMGDCVENRDGPDFIPTDGSAIALPQPQLANFKKGLKFDVYTGPGTNYVREADGKATVSTNDWIYVFGEENGWLLIEYHVKESLNRFGWIRANAREAGVSVPVLSWANDEAIYPGRSYVTNDPLNTGMEIDLREEARCVRLATLDEWAYIEIPCDGKMLRAFIDTDMLTLKSDYADKAIVVADEAALYADAQGQTRTATLFRGAVLDLLEGNGDMLRVRLHDEEEAAYEIAGWVSAAQARKGAWPGDADAVPDALYEGARQLDFNLSGLRDKPNESCPVTWAFNFVGGLIRLAEVNGWAYVRELDKAWVEGFLPARQLMPVRQEYIDMAWNPQDSPSVYVAGQNTVLRAQPDEQGEPVATLLRGMIVHALGEEDGWVFVDTGNSSDFQNARVRGYLPADSVQIGFEMEKLMPVMRLNVPEGQALYVESAEMFSGAECILRAVSADGAYGLCLFDLRVAQTVVPMEWLEDTGRRVEDDFEQMGRGMTVVSQSEWVPYWSSVEATAYPDSEVGMTSVGETVTVLAMRGEFAAVALPGLTGLYIMRTENLK